LRLDPANGVTTNDGNLLEAGFERIAWHDWLRRAA